MKNIRGILSAAVLSVSLIACSGGGGSGSGGGGGSDSGTIESATANHTIYLPEGVSHAVLGTNDGLMLSAGTTGTTNSSPITISSSGIETLATTTTKDVAGFIIQRPAFTGLTTGADLLTKVESLVSGLTTITKFANTNKFLVTTPSAAVGSYSLTSSTSIQPTTLAATLLDKLAESPEATPAEADAIEPYATAYTVYVATIYFSTSDAIIAVAVVPESLSGNYQHITSGVASPSNIGDITSTTSDGTSSFTVAASTTKADFLFVVDNSGSMGNEQTAISAAATEFVTAVTSSGLDYSMGVITTDSSTLQDTNADGGFTADTSEFKTDLTPGTSGSFIESGVWFAEDALKSLAKGDSKDGTATLAGRPRTGASLTVIMLSDEPDQYTSYSGGSAFDASSNLFVSRKYSVFSIIPTSSSSYYKYDILSTATNGATADITNISAYPTIMKNIVLSASGAASSYVLTDTGVIASTINVKIGGNTVSRSFVNGWSYSSQNNSIAFHGTALPTAGSAISITYKYL